MEWNRPAPKPGSFKEAQDSYRSVPQNSGIRTGAGRRDSGRIESPHAGAKGGWKSAYRQLANEINVRHYSPKTLKSYTTWVRKMQYFSKSKAPEPLSTDDVNDFLSFLTLKRKVSASSQNQAFNALPQFRARYGDRSRRNREKGSQFCQPFAPGQLRHSDHPGTAGAQ